MIILVCGGRDFIDKDLLYRTLEAEEPDCILQGGAKGADTLAKSWAEDVGIPCFECKANWNFYDKRAGPIRNAWMLQYMRPDMVVAFPTINSKGTWDMLKKAEQADVMTVVVN